MRLSPVWAMKVLCIAEKPAIAKSIASALGGGASRAVRSNYCVLFDFGLTIILTLFNDLEKSWKVYL